MFFANGKDQDQTSISLIAEVGVNHNGNLDLAKELIDEAARAGANYVKFQSFIPSLMASPSTPKVKYQKESDGHLRTHREMLESLALDFDQQDVLIAHSQSAGISFVSTPYDPESLRFLVSRNVPFIKIASADIVDVFLHELTIESRIPVVLSTGGARMDEIEFVTEMYREGSANSVCLLHAVSAYPCAAESLNLRSIPFMRDHFKVDVGFSDHSVEPLISSVTAATLGAVVIERHFTIDKELPGPDHSTSSNPEELTALVRALRVTSASLGEPGKSPHHSEAEFMKISRKSIHAARNIPKGKVIRLPDLCLLRPGNGISPLRLRDLIGRTSSRNLIQGDLIRDEDVDWNSEGG